MIKHQKVIFIKDFQNIKKDTKGEIVTGFGNFYTVKIKNRNYYLIPSIYLKRLK
jgi:hypothetical protein